MSGTSARRLRFCSPSSTTSSTSPRSMPASWSWISTRSTSTATAKAAAGLVADRLREHAIALDLDVARAPKSFHGDDHRIRQVLCNLLSNAANYAPADSTVTLACEHGRRARCSSPSMTTVRACRRRCSTRVPPLRTARQWRPPARRRAGPVDRQELRRTAWRHGPHRNRQGQGHDRHLPLSPMPCACSDAAE